MNFKKIVSGILVLIFSFCSFQTIAFAENDVDTHENITIEFHNKISDEAREKVIAHFHGEEDMIAARGITCTLFGHKLETGSTSVVTHKVNSSAPRCLRETYNYEICSRCDYSEYTFLYSEYIYCC
jgi:hypothetical protein